MLTLDDTAQYFCDSELVQEWLLERLNCCSGWLSMSGEVTAVSGAVASLGAVLVVGDSGQMSAQS